MSTTLEHHEPSERLLGASQPNYSEIDCLEHSSSSPAAIISNSSPVPSASDSEDGEFDDQAQAYGVESGRYVVLAALTLVNGTNALLWMTFASIVTPTEQYYGVTTSQINTLNIIFAAMYSGLFWISGVVLPKTGLGWGLVICASLNVGTTLCRLSSTWFTPTFDEILAGNILGGLCQSLILSAPPMLSNQWFALDERNFATGVGVAAQIFGGALGMLLPANIVTEASASKFGILFWIQFGVSALGFIVALLAKKAPSLPPTAAAFKFDENVTRRSFHHERLPISQKRLASTAEYPPSQGALSASSHKSSKSHTSTQNQNPSARKYLKRAAKNVISTLKAIITNKNFMLLLVLSGIGQGSIWSFGTLLVQIVQPYNVSQQTIGWIGFAGQLVGGFASVAIGGVLGFVKDYKLILVILSVATTVVALIFPVVAIIIGDSISTAICNALVAVLYVGLCIVGIAQCPVLFELGVEVTFPLSEEITSPLIMWTPSFLSLIFVTFQGVILTENPTHEKALVVLFINVGFLFLAAVTSLFLTPQYKRREYEQIHAGKSKGDDGAINV